MWQPPGDAAVLIGQLMLSSLCYIFISYLFTYLEKRKIGKERGNSYQKNEEISGSKGGGGRVRLLDVDTWELAGF